MRILYSHRIQSHDGMGAYIEALVAALRAAGHEVCVAGPPAYDLVALGGESPLPRIRRLLAGALGQLAEMVFGLVSTARFAHAARACADTVLPITEEHGRTALLFGAINPGAMWRPSRPWREIRHCAHVSAPKRERKCCGGILPGQAMRAALSSSPKTR